MKTAASVAIALVVGVVAAGAGYWLSERRHQDTAASAEQATTLAKSGRKLLYYRNPMGLPDTSPVPKKDPMGMDYVPVYEGEETSQPTPANQIAIGTEKVQKLGVRSEEAKLRRLDKVVRAAGRIEPDERRIFAIAPKFEGYVQRLYVNVTGQAVAKGQPLFEVYSPDLVSAQREYAIAMQGAQALQGAAVEARSSMQQLAEASLARLKNWDISEEQLKALASSGHTQHTLTFRSPVAGIITEKKAVQGMRFMAGETLYQVSDLSSVWVIADVFEQDIGLIKNGSEVKVKIDAYSNEVFTGKIGYVYPTLKAETRTIPVRIEMANRGGKLKPAMFAEVEIPVGGSAPVTTVPTSAVIDSGTRQIVIVQVNEGRFEPREVKLGHRGSDDVEILTGVRPGERVIVAANFLIDAESNLKAAVSGFGTPGVASGREALGQGVAASHQGEGTVESVDAKSGTMMLNHGAIASLKWPPMTMEFKVANSALLAGLKAGDAVSFEFVERKAGEWVITAVRPRQANPAVTPRSGR